MSTIASILDDDDSEDFPLTPIVDVMMILSIAMIVNMMLSMVKVAMFAVVPEPAPTTVVTKAVDRAVVVIDESGKLTWGEKAIDWAAYEEALKLEAKKPQGLGIAIAGHPKAPLGVFTRLVEVAASHGVKTQLARPE